MDLSNVQKNYHFSTVFHLWICWCEQRSSSLRVNYHKWAELASTFISADDENCEEQRQQPIEVPKFTLSLQLIALACLLLILHSISCHFIVYIINILEQIPPLWCQLIRYFIKYEEDYSWLVSLTSDNTFFLYFNIASYRLF